MRKYSAKMKAKSPMTKKPNSAYWNKRKIGKVQRKRKVPLCKLFQTSLKHQGKIFFAESTLHGVRYIAETDRPIIERLMWFVCVLIGTISTIVIIVNLWEKFQTNPTITGLDTDFHNWNVPFPAITLCPNRPANPEKLIELVDSIINNAENADTGQSEDLLEILTAISQLSMSNMDYFKEKLKESAASLLGDTNLQNLILPVMATCEELFFDCEWKTESYNCCSGFHPVFTEAGFCYTFNSKHYEKLSVDGPVEIDKPEIRYIKETDPKWALKWFMQNTNFTNDLNISVYIHTYDEVPGLDMKPHHVWNYKTNQLQFSMRETYTTSNARQLSIRQRHCLFDQEVKLTIDDTYTFMACSQQCRVNNAHRICGCVPYFYPSMDTQIYRHCRLDELSCIVGNLTRITNVDKCSCELGCSNTIYEVDKLNEASDNSDTTSDDREEKEKIYKNFECEFTSWPMIKYKREVLFGWVDLLVSFGGIAGLFLGFSLLSGVEIIYYFTIRTCCMLYKQQDELVEMVLVTKTKDNNGITPGIVPYFIKGPKDGGNNELVQRNIKNMTIKAKPLVVKPLQPKQPHVMPPFGIDYRN